MDRRNFLLNSAALAAGAITHEFAHAVPTGLPSSEHCIAPPVIGATTENNRTAFNWETSGLVFSFEFDDDRLRFRHVLPSGVAEPPRLPAPNMVSGLETSIHCTGEDIPDHHGAKLCGGSPGIRMRFVRREETITAKGKRLILTQEDAPLGLRVQSIYESLNGIAVVRRTTNITNII
jgi:alpha-galactosidase